MADVDEYLATLEPPARAVIERLYARATDLVPDAVQGRSYGMAALRYRERALVSVVATKAGFSVFPFSADVVAGVVSALPAGFESTKGGMRFTAASPIPDAVFDQLVLARRAEIDAALG